MMTAVLRVMLVAALAAPSIPAVAAAQGTPIDSLNRRVVLLERNVADLAQRVLELEALIRVEPPPGYAVPASPKWQDLQNWRRLSIGMTMDGVRALLGEPVRVDAGYVTFWRWGSANVSFISGKVDGWSEPAGLAVGGSAPVTDKIYLEAEVDDPPDLISAGPRRYPPVLERAGISGRVVAQFVVDTTGHPESAGFTVLTSTNPAFNEPAREMIMTSVFQPGRLRGQTVRVQIQQAVAFNP